MIQIKVIFFHDMLVAPLINESGTNRLAVGMQIAGGGGGEIESLLLDDRKDTLYVTKSAGQEKKPHGFRFPRRDDRVDRVIGEGLPVLAVRISGGYSYLLTEVPGATAQTPADKAKLK